MIISLNIYIIILLLAFLNNKKIVLPLEFEKKIVLTFGILQVDFLNYNYNWIKIILNCGTVLKNKYYNIDKKLY